MNDQIAKLIKQAEAEEKHVKRTVSDRAEIQAAYNNLQSLWDHVEHVHYVAVHCVTARTTPTSLEEALMWASGASKPGPDKVDAITMCPGCFRTAAQHAREIAEAMESIAARFDAKGAAS